MASYTYLHVELLRRFDGLDREHIHPVILVQLRVLVRVGKHIRGGVAGGTKTTAREDSTQ